MVLLVVGSSSSGRNNVDDDKHRRAPPDQPAPVDQFRRRQRRTRTSLLPRKCAAVGIAAVVVTTVWGAALLLLHRRLVMLDLFAEDEAPVGGAPPPQILFDSSLSSSSASARRLPPGMLPIDRAISSQNENGPGATATSPAAAEGRSGNATRWSSKDAFVPAPLYYEEDVVVSHKRRRPGPVVCRPPAWSFLHFPTCNLFHELDLAAGGGQEEEEEQDSYVIARGYYRDVWVVLVGANEGKVVLKTTRFRHDFDVAALMSAKRDALVMERLAKRENIVTPYGHCGASTLVEAVPYEVERYVVPRLSQPSNNNGNSNNMYSPAEKLRMALEMAEALAALHGYEGGAVSHNDVQLSQWLRSRNDRLVLGDFHSSQILSWDQQRQAYCPYSTGTVFGNYRSPEEYTSSLLNEQVDVYSFGNNIYCLLTGRWVFHDIDDDQAVRAKVREGVRPELVGAPRTVEERKLVELMSRCWEEDPDRRITIFHAVAFLREAVADPGTVRAT